MAPAERSTLVFSTRSLVDEGVIPEHFHGPYGPGEAGGNRSRHLHGRDNGSVVVRGGDDHSPGACQGGGQIIGSGMPMLQEGDGAGSEDQENAEDNILDKAALGAENSDRAHRRMPHKYTADFLWRKGRGLLERFFREKND